MPVWMANLSLFNMHAWQNCWSTLWIISPFLIVMNLRLSWLATFLCPEEKGKQQFSFSKIFQSQILSHCFLFILTPRKLKEARLVFNITVLYEFSFAYDSYLSPSSQTTFYDIEKDIPIIWQIWVTDFNFNG